MTLFLVGLSVGLFIALILSFVPFPKKSKVFRTCPDSKNCEICKGLNIDIYV